MVRLVKKEASSMLRDEPRRSKTPGAGGRTNPVSDGLSAIFPALSETIDGRSTCARPVVTGPPAAKASDTVTSPPAPALQNLMPFSAR